MRMNVKWVRRYCLSLPHTTEQVQWGHAAMPLEPPFDVWLSLKCTPEEFAELTERPGIIPAPYMARAYWIALESDDALPVAETKRLLRQSYKLVVARLPQKKRAALQRK